MQANPVFHATETRGMLKRDGVQQTASSEGRGWTSLYASLQVEAPFDGHFGAVEDHLIVWHKDGPTRIEADGGGGRFCKTVPAGGLHLIPGGSDVSIRLADPLSTMHVYIRHNVVKEIAGELAMGDASRVTLKSGILDADTTLTSLLRPVEMAIESEETSGRLYADYLALSLAAYLVENHSDARLRAAPRQKRQPGRSLTADRAMAYMQENLSAPIGLDDIARAVERSPSHVFRIFKAEIGVPPHRCLIQLRIARARELLANTAIPIAEIAAECGFSHQEHLTHQFRRHCRTTPAAYRRAQRN